jgi:predicted nucleic-acid-binding Zn-ribbon protein
MEGNTMAHSYARPLGITCLKCGKQSTVEVHMIVDVDERPDLLQAILNDTFFMSTCPHCGSKGFSDTPLLVFRPKQEPHLLFCMAEGMSPEWNMQQAKELLGRLKKSVGWGWRNEWLSGGLQTLQQHSNLSLALGDNPQAAIRQHSAQQDQDAKRIKAEDPKRYYRTLLHAFFSAQDLAVKKQLVELYPDLLNQDAAKELDEMMLEALKQHNTAAAEVISQNGLVLAHLRGELKDARVVHI